MSSCNEIAHNGRVLTALTGCARAGRFPHALLLEGPAGCGKKAAAEILAQTLQCTADPGQRPCGLCRDCAKAAKGVHPDILFYGQETGGGHGSFHIDEVRGLRGQAYVRPNEGPCKVFILLNVHNMTVQAQNALLKILEEPPKNVHFILTCGNKAALLATIFSRVSAFALEPSFPMSDGEQSAPAPDADVVHSQAEEILTALCTGSEWDALALLCRYERDRTGFAALLEEMRAVAAGLLRTSLQKPQPGALPVGSLPLMGILAIIEELDAAVRSNANPLLLVTAACSKIKQTLAGQK